jgi:hypothetical protein
MIRDLPFKVRSVKPEIIHVTSNTKLPEDVKQGRHGSVAIFYKGKIYTFRKNLPKYMIEHEIAHAQITDDKTKTKTGSTAWLNDEIAADILAHRRTGKPEHIQPYMFSRLKDLGYYHTVNDDDKKYNRYEVNSHAVAHLMKAYARYYDYLPKEWQDDVDNFKKLAEKELAAMRAKGLHQRPGGDFYIQRSRSGDFKARARRVSKKIDPVTGFMVMRPSAGVLMQ